MDLVENTTTRAARPRAQVAAAGTRALAEALAHLLRRDDDHPARWRTASFADAVESARVELDPVGSIGDLPMARAGMAGPIGFDEAVTRLARNPIDVAVAIRRLELGARHDLPAWPELVRRGLPARPTDLETALWFG